MEVKKPNKSLLFYAFVVMIILILLNALVIPKISERSVTETTYDEFLALLDAKYVKQVEIDNSSEVIYYEASKDGMTRICKTGLMNDPDLVNRLQAAGTADHVSDRLDSSHRDLRCPGSVAQQTDDEEHGWTGSHVFRKEQCKDLCKIFHRYQIFRCSR